MIIERQIYDLETSYLEETRNVGNIFIGWESLVAVSNTPPSKKKKVLSNEER
jgi:hypothetical protein